MHPGPHELKIGHGSILRNAFGGTVPWKAESRPDSLKVQAVVAEHKPALVTAISPEIGQISLVPMSRGERPRQCRRGLRSFGPARRDRRRSADPFTLGDGLDRMIRDRMRSSSGSALPLEPVEVLRQTMDTCGEESGE